jgi:hypothetical protein
MIYGEFLFLMLVNLADMDVKHLSQESLFCKGIAHKIETDTRAKRAPSTQEVVFGFGF